MRWMGRCVCFRSKGGEGQGVMCTHTNYKKLSSRLPHTRWGLTMCVPHIYLCVANHWPIRFRTVRKQSKHAMQIASHLIKTSSLLYPNQN